MAPSWLMRKIKSSEMTEVALKMTEVMKQKRAEIKDLAIDILNKRSQVWCRGCLSTDFLKQYPEN